jgi:hypothetical protein
MRLNRTVRRFIHADSAFWAGKLSTTENSRGLPYQARAATRTYETKAEYAENAEEEKNENGYPKVVAKPRGRPPASGQYADADQAQAEKSIPAPQRLPDCHRSLRIGGTALGPLSQGCHDCRLYLTFFHGGAHGKANTLIVRAGGGGVCSLVRLLLAARGSVALRCGAFHTCCGSAP